MHPELADKPPTVVRAAPAEVASAAIAEAKVAVAAVYGNRPELAGGES
jgi:hypothetical protein